MDRSDERGARSARWVSLALGAAALTLFARGLLSPPPSRPLADVLAGGPRSSIHRAEQAIELGAAAPLGAGPDCERYVEDCRSACAQYPRDGLARRECAAFCRAASAGCRR